MTFGGGGVPPLCLTPKWIQPYDLAYKGERLAVVGRSSFRIGLTIYGGPSFSIVNSSNGEVMDERRFAPTVDIGVDGEGTAFHSVVISESDSFYAVGTVKDAANNQKSMPMTARIRADRIFGHGMEN